MWRREITLLNVKPTVGFTFNRANEVIFLPHTPAVLYVNAITL